MVITPVSKTGIASSILTTRAKGSEIPLFSTMDNRMRVYPSRGFERKFDPFLLAEW